jgi:hypothetical protein
MVLIMRNPLAIVLASLWLVSACVTQQTPIQKLELAEQYLSKHGGDASYRAVAYDLFKDVLVESQSDNEKVRAHFGVGMIGTLDLLQAIPPLLVAEDGEDETAAEESTLPPADKLAATLRILVREVISKGIAEHFKIVSAEDAFQFRFEKLVLPFPGAKDDLLDLSGDWDLTEIRLIYALTEFLATTVEYVYAYDGLVETVLRAALSGADLPPMPESPADFPAWFVEAAQATGLDPLPWLDPAFGILAEPDAMPLLQARMVDSMGAIVGSMTHLLGEETTNQDSHIFTKNNFPGKAISLFVPEASQYIFILNALFGPERIRELFIEVQRSLAEPEDVFAAPDFVWQLLGAALDLIKFEGPSDPVSLRVPAVNLSAFFTHPIQDLKDRNNGLLPHYDAEGFFTVHSEQEPGNADDFTDIGIDGFIHAATEPTRPGAGDDTWNDRLGLRGSDTLPPISHFTPFDRIDDPNGIVDPVYLFFGDASFNGWFYPITNSETGPAYKANKDVTYGNPDLMRLLSSIVWIFDGLKVD